MFKKVTSLLMSVVLFTAILSGCSEAKDDSKDSDTPSAAVELIDSSKLTMYTNAEFAPYEFVKDGEIVGVDIEIAKEIAKKLGVELVVENSDFDGIVSSIASGRGDIAISGITITDERKESVDFSDSYIQSVQYLILPIDSEIGNMDDLKGKRIGAATGFTGAFLVDDEINLDDGSLKDSGATLTEYNTATDACLDMKNGKLDAVVMDELVAISIANENSAELKAVKLLFADGTDTAEEFGVILAKGKPELLKVINEVITDLKTQGKIDEYVEEFSK